MTSDNAGQGARADQEREHAEQNKEAPPFMDDDVPVRAGRIPHGIDVEEEEMPGPAADDVPTRAGRIPVEGEH